MDDLVIRFDGHSAFLDLQAKTGLRNDNRFDEVLSQATRSLGRNADARAVLAVDFSSTRSVHFTLREGLNRLRSSSAGNPPEIVAKVQTFLQSHGVPDGADRFFVVATDPTDGAGTDRQLALLLLTQVLRHPSAAYSVWDSLCERADELITRRGTIDVREIVRFVEVEREQGLVCSEDRAIIEVHREEGFSQVTPFQTLRDSSYAIYVPWRREADRVRMLLNRHQPLVALGILDGYAATEDIAQARLDVRTEFSVLKSLCLATLGYFDEAARVLESDKEVGGTPDVLGLLAKLRLQTGQAVQAVKLAKSSIKASPRQVYAWEVLVEIEHQPLLEVLPADLSETPEILAAFARQAHRNRNWKSAIRYVGQALAAERGRSQSENQGALATELRLALAQYQYSLSLDSGVPTARQARRGALSVLNGIITAMADTTNRVFASRVFTLRGRVRRDSGDATGGRNDYMTALELDPYRFPARYNLAAALHDDSEFEPALRVISENPFRPLPALLSIIASHCLHALGREEEARAFLIQAEETTATDYYPEVTLYTLAQTYLRQLHDVESADRLVTQIEEALRAPGNAPPSRTETLKDGSLAHLHSLLHLARRDRDSAVQWHKMALDEAHTDFDRLENYRDFISFAEREQVDLPDEIRAELDDTFLKSMYGLDN